MAQTKTGTPKSVPQPRTAREIKAWAMRLERVAGNLQALHSQMGEEGLESLYFFNVPSMESAVGAIETFAEEATKSWFAFVSGNPYTETSVKTRAGVVDAAKANGEKKPRKKRAPKKSAGTGGAGEKGEG